MDDLILTGSWSAIQGIVSRYADTDYPELTLTITYDSLYAYDMGQLHNTIKDVVQEDFEMWDNRTDVFKPFLGGKWQVFQRHYKKINAVLI